MLSIVDGTHPIWLGDGSKASNSDEAHDSRDSNMPVISEAYKQTVRAFLAQFFDEVMRRSSVQEREWDVISMSTEVSCEKHTLDFDFRGGSIGNFVFTGARLFFHSLEVRSFTAYLDLDLE